MAHSSGNSSHGQDGGGIPMDFEWDPDSNSDDDGDTPTYAALFSRSTLSKEEEEKEYVMISACRDYMELGIRNGTIDPRIQESNMIPPYEWVQFRQQIMKDGKFSAGNVSLVKREGILFNAANLKPICTHPSCFSENFPPNPSGQMKCVRHRGNKISYLVLELVFKNKVLGRTTGVAVEHVLLMVSHYDTDTELQLRDSVIREYYQSGSVQRTVAGLERIKFMQCARRLREARSMMVRRQFKFDDPLKASREFAKLSVAYELIVKNLGPPFVITEGNFAGFQLLNVRRPNSVPLHGEPFTNMEERLKLAEEIREEQLLTFGIRVSTESALFYFSENVTLPEFHITTTTS